MDIIQQTNTPALISHPSDSALVSVPAKLGGLDGHKGGLSFTAQDFRLFNFFVESAYPHHPVDNDSTWTHEIPAIAHQFPFLLHAMLALSASELANSPSASSSEMRVVAMNHRVKSIEDLRRAVDKGLSSVEEANAMIATCFSLLFQSTLIHDGLSEYMSFIRGTVAIGIQMYIRNFRTFFANLYGDGAVLAMNDALLSTPLLDPQIVTSAIRSLERLSPICRPGSVEIEMLGLLSNMARSLVTSSRDAYMELRKIYAHLSYAMPYPQFQAFTDPENEVGQILQAHFVALQLVMTPIAEVEYLSPVKREMVRKERERERRGDQQGKEGRWLVSIHERMRGRRDRARLGNGEFVWESFYSWTMWVEGEFSNRGGI